ncbi:Mpv17/PMP22 [Trinorchestia longiramus]|nr:Mpv17/PMP22 [Trinorchestia longiramus]
MNFVRAYLAAAKHYPKTTLTLQSGGLLAAGDGISQVAVEGHHLRHYEWSRTARFFVLGAFLTGPILRRWYGFLNRRFTHQGKQGNFKKFAADQLVFGPTFTVIIIASVGVLQRMTPQQVVVKVRTTFLDVVVAGMMVWPVAQLINFTLVPLQFQILFVQTVGLFWNTFLAWKTNRNIDTTTEHKCQRRGNQSVTAVATRVSPPWQPECQRRGNQSVSAVAISVSAVATSVSAVATRVSAGVKPVLNLNEFNFGKKCMEKSIQV